MVIKGKCYNISINGKSPLWGYYLLITTEGEEYLIQRNSKLSANIYRKAYRTQFSFRNYIYDKEKKSNPLILIGAPIGLLLARAFRKIIPMDLFFGEANTSMDLLEGTMNILIFLIIFLTTLWCVKQCRFIQLKNFIRKQGFGIELVGAMKSKEYLQKLANGIKVW